MHFVPTSQLPYTLWHDSLLPSPHASLRPGPSSASPFSQPRGSDLPVVCSAPSSHSRSPLSVVLAWCFVLGLPHSHAESPFRPARGTVAPVGGPTGPSPDPMATLCNSSLSVALDLLGRAPTPPRPSEHDRFVPGLFPTAHSVCYGGRSLPITPPSNTVSTPCPLFPKISGVADSQ
jgi:hypothetical protein